jgi:DNA-binding winged helix-turn-helix (wHTH) protein
VLQPSDEMTPLRVRITTELDDENATVGRGRVHPLIVAETPWASPEEEVGFVYDSHGTRRRGERLLIAFSPFQLDLKDERLCRGDSPVELRPKAFQMLRYLVEHAGRLVTRDELLDAVWPGLAIAPETLTQVIAELRRALGDDAHQPDFIQTVHRRGFRFIAEVEREVEPAHQHEESSGTTDRPTLFPPRIAHRPVGRDAELAHLGELLRAARGGQRQVAFVTGEPGIGKTSLIRTFLGDLAEADEPVWIGMGKCVEHHGEEEAYLPLLDAFERLAHQMDTASFVRHFSRYAPSWLAQLPWLTEPDAAEETRNPTPSTTPARMLREFFVAVEALSEERTLVLWIDDMHWADQSSVDLLAALAVRPDPARLLVLATYRPVDAAAKSHPIARAACCLRGAATRTTRRGFGQSLSE